MNDSVVFMMCFISDYVKYCSVHLVSSVRYALCCCLFCIYINGYPLASLDFFSTKMLKTRTICKLINVNTATCIQHRRKT